MTFETDLKGVTVLVVDDNADNAEVLAMFLRACGAGVLTAGSGIEAITFLDSDPVIDVLLTDLAMPGLNGIELVQRMRSHSQYADLPAIAVSGFPEKYFAGDSERFSAFILKPVELEDLVVIVKRLVTSSPR